MSLEDTTTSTDSDDIQAQETAQLDDQETQAVQGSDTTDNNDTSADTDDSDDMQDSDDSSEDDEIKAWATKKGLSLDDPVKLARMVRESETKMHEATQQASNELKGAVTETSIENGEDESSQLISRLKVTEFYSDNPEARAYDETMAQIVQEKPYLAEDLKTVYDLARFRSADAKIDAERKAVRKETLQKAAQAESAQAPQASASTRKAAPEITDDDVANMSLAEYKEWKAKTGMNPFKAPGTR